MKERWQSTVALVLVALVAGYVLGRGFMVPRAQAQEGSAAGHMAVVMGVPQGVADTGFVSFIVVDSLEQTVLVYEYRHSQRDKLMLSAARSYRYDKLLPAVSTVPTLKEVQDLLNSTKGP